MSDEIVMPVWVLPRGVARWETAETAALIADQRLPVETAKSQIRRFAQKGFIYASGQRRTGPTAANLFSPTEVATTKLLSVLTALGVEDLGSAGTGARAWWEDQPKLKGFGSPIMAAMAGAVRGQWWVYQLTLLCGDQTGQLQVLSSVYDPDASWRPASEGHTAEMLPIATVTVHLTPLLLPLHRRMMDAIGATKPAN